jgi:hypothetical protein
MIVKLEPFAGDAYLRNSGAQCFDLDDEAAKPGRSIQNRHAQFKFALMRGHAFDGHAASWISC